MTGPVGGGAPNPRPAEAVAPRGAPTKLYEIRSAPLADLRAWARDPHIGDARIAALETLSERIDLPWEDFAEIFLGPPVWRDPDEHVRWLAVNALGKRHPERAFEPLIEATQDSAWLVREHAQFACLKAISNIARALESRTGGTRRFAGDALPVLLYFLRAPALDVVRGVEQVLARIFARDPNLTLDVFDARLDPAPERERASLVRACTLGLIAAARSGGELIHAERLTAALEAGAHAVSVTVRTATAQSCVDFVDFLLSAREDAPRTRPDTSSNASTAPFPMPPTLPGELFKLLVALFEDPDPSVRESLMPVLDHSAVLLAFGALLLERHQQARAEEIPFEPLALATLRAAAGQMWNTDALPTEVRDQWFAVALRFCGHGGFRVRRAARALLGSFGPTVVSPLLELCTDEAELVARDAELCTSLQTVLSRLTSRLSQRRALDAHAAACGFERVLAVCRAQGGMLCVEMLERAAQDAVLHGFVRELALAREAILKRFFALRSFAITLWNAPERESEAGEKMRSVLRVLSTHPCSFIARAASLGR